MKKLKTVLSAIAATTVIIALCCVAVCQEMPYATVSSVGADGTLFLNAGSEIGLEQGDILVVQREGMKLGLAHVEQVSVGRATAGVMRFEQGASIKVGDIAAFQMISSGVMPAPATEWRQPEYYQPAPAQPEQPPDIMKQEWISPAPFATDYDEEINKQLGTVKRDPGNRGAMIKLADAYFKKGWYKHSIQWNERAISNDPGADDNDKLLFQIIRAYGYLNQPEKQSEFLGILVKKYPESVFVTMKDRALVKTAEENLLPDWKKAPPLKDDLGFSKGGMRVMQKSGMNTGQPGSGKVEDKLLHGEPGLMTPRPSEPKPSSRAPKPTKYDDDEEDTETAIETEEDTEPARRASRTGKTSGSQTEKAIEELEVRQEVLEEELAKTRARVELINEKPELKKKKTKTSFSDFCNFTS